MARQTIRSHAGKASVQSEIKRWGNSLGVRIPKEIRNDLNLSDGSKILISLNRKEKKIIIENLSKNQTIYDLAESLSLADLTSKISKKNKPEKEEVLSSAIGKELW
jgi:antitoxin MazE